MAVNHTNNHTNISKEKVLDILDQRMTELKEIKERNKYRGLIMRGDEYLIDGGINEIEILKEMIKKYF
jgi:hypothetical protein